jgi:hypothetical protein
MLCERTELIASTLALHQALMSVGYPETSLATVRMSAIITGYFYILVMIDVAAAAGVQFPPGSPQARFPGMTGTS